MSIIAREIVETAVYDLVKLFTTASVYLSPVPENAGTPYIRISGIGDVPVYAMAGVEYLDADFQLDIFGKRRIGAKAIRQLTDTLITEIDRYPITITGYSNTCVTVTEAGVLSEEDEYIRIRTEINVRGF